MHSKSWGQNLYQIKCLPCPLRLNQDGAQHQSSAFVTCEPGLGSARAWGAWPWGRAVQAPPLGGGAGVSAEEGGGSLRPRYWAVEAAATFAGLPLGRLALPRSGAAPCCRWAFGDSTQVSTQAHSAGRDAPFPSSSSPEQFEEESLLVRLGKQPLLWSGCISAGRGIRCPSPLLCPVPLGMRMGVDTRFAGRAWSSPSAPSALWEVGGLRPHILSRRV